MFSNGFCWHKNNNKMIDIIDSRYWYYIIVITRNNCRHKTLLGNVQWRAVDTFTCSIKHCEKWLHLK